MKKWDEVGRLREDTSSPDPLSVNWLKLRTGDVIRDKSFAPKLPTPISDTNLPFSLRVEVKTVNAFDTIRRAMVHERESGTLFHFAPLIFGLGIAAYFMSPAEPVLSVVLVTFVIFAVTAAMFRFHEKLWIFTCMIALFFGGMSAGKIRTDTINTNTLVQQITGKITGIIIEVSRNQRGSPRYLIKPQNIEGIGQAQLPRYIRLSAASKHRLGLPGDKISGLARLRPISGPAYPGSFDFSFNSWYNGLGGSGFFMGAPVTAMPGNSFASLSAVSRFEIFINSLRLNIAKRIRSALPGESGDIAVALIIGDRTGIDRDTQESLRSSGLAHVLAISGMHMALVSLTMIWAVRFVLALNMRLAVSRPIKNWAAIAGFITATSYLAISGMGVATQRAWIMISVMLLAAIISRKSVTLRAVALAALIILAFQPESLLSPGFQMSFAAVAAIVAAYEWLDERRNNHREKPRANRLVRFFGTLIFTSLIAGLATSLFAAYHFQRIAPLGVLTNLLAMPLVSIIVMPAALVSVLAMPYGFEQIALVPMGAGIEQVVSISDYVNSLGGNGITGKLGAAVLPMSFIGLFLLTMLKSFLRLSGVVVLLATTIFWTGSPPPDILLSEGGRAIGVKNDEGQLVMLYPNRSKFIRDIWLRAFSDDKAGKPSLKQLCNRDICMATTVQGALVYVVYDPDLLPQACNRADILLAPRLRWVNCRGRKPALVIKRGQLEEFGAHAIYLQGTSSVDAQKGTSSGSEKFQIIRVSTAIKSTTRPWNRYRQGRAAYLQD